MTTNNQPHVALLAGGVGGARMAQGFYTELAAGGQLDIVGNTGDDCEMWDLRVCPDLDTLMYTLTGIADPAHGWGIAGDTYHAQEALRTYAATDPASDGWFTLGDKDLATHIRRTQLLRQGVTLTDVTEGLCRALGLADHCRIVPMSDDLAATLVQTQEYGELEFQEYFVRRRANATVGGLTYGGESARPSAQALATLSEADCIIFAPSNPFLSIETILRVAGVRQIIGQTGVAARTGRRAAISNIVGGQALKGPAARLMHDLGHEVSALGVARLYAGLVDLFVLDEQDADYADSIAALGMRPLVAQTVMRNDDDKQRLAHTIVNALCA